MQAVYIHIPFCDNICSYCDFCKLYYKKEWVENYLLELKKEIISRYQGEKIKTLYIGGGTPTSLNIKELSFLFSIIKVFDLSNLEEFTIECNIENLTYDKLDLFKDNKVNRLSIGVQTFNNELISFLHRKHSKKDVFRLIKYAKKIGFININVDLIYGVPNQKLSYLKKDIKLFMELDIPHISAYSLIIEDNTKLKINNIEPIDEDVNGDMYEYINKFLTDNNYIHYEISNYAKKGYQSKHNLVYWHNEEYYGFGLGATSFIKNKRYENTKSLTDYLKGKFLVNEIILSKKEMMENEMILGLRKIEGVDKDKFYNKYSKNIEDVFTIKRLLSRGDLIQKDTKIFIPEEKLFIANEILINFIE